MEVIKSGSCQILAGSTLDSGGSNSGGGSTAAESKGFMFSEDDGENM